MLMASNSIVQTISSYVMYYSELNLVKKLCFYLSVDWVVAYENLKTQEKTTR